jgi:dihydrofolate reductase
MKLSLFSAPLSFLKILIIAVCLPLMMACGSSSSSGGGGGGDGGDNSGYLNNVWSSDDGENWTQATDSAAFSARTGHQAVVFKDKMWVIGGCDNNGYLNDVWSSTDGITWTTATDSAQFSGREEHQSVVFNNKMWVIGGNDGTTNTNDVWSSADGKNWTKATDSAQFSPRSAHQTVIYGNNGNNIIWAIGGNDGQKENDLWFSEDGKTWRLEPPLVIRLEFSARQDHQAVVFNDGDSTRMWVIGGLDDSGSKNDLWRSSTDGFTWTTATDSAQFSPRNSHQVIVFDNKMWVIGGNDGTTNTNDVWSSTNGITWTQATDSAQFSPRSTHQAVVFKDKIWVIGGFGGG